jgi:TetR/AcrR family transcriptional regulator, repressor for uid operon
MSEAVSRISPDELTLERRRQILDAAERRFARAGFHRTTMNDVAAEAGMSPGNLYRYFPSKDALVAGICERDRADLGQEFVGLNKPGSDFRAAFLELGRRHFEDERTDKAKLCLEIWSEATRNPTIAALQTEFHRSLTEQFVLAFEAAKKDGSVHPSVDCRAVASVVSKLGDGLFVRRATATDFDPEREVAEVFAVIGALLSGAIPLPASERRETAS